MIVLKYHIIALIGGVILDAIIGDPYNLPHPIRLLGRLISALDKAMLRNMDSEKNNKRNIKREAWYGVVTVITVVMATFACTAAILCGAYIIYPYVGVIVEAILTSYILAGKSLKVESMKVYKALKGETIEKARYAVSMIVGRDTAELDKDGVTRAAVETIAENTSDGVIAPLIYICIGGPVLGMTYKAINTMDSMIGYHNDRYEYYGKCAAKADDIVNYIPARISAVVMIVAAFILELISVGNDKGIYSGTGAIRIFKRDRYNHKSPNSAQTESVCAGALNLRLAGDAKYFGKVVKKPYIGDEVRPICAEDIVRANRLMQLTEFITVILCIAILLGVERLI